MSKNNVDFNWVQEQLDSASVKPEVAEVVISLLETWETLEYDSGNLKEVTEIFTELIHNRALLPAESTEVWVEALRGSIHTGDVIRVRFDAFDGDQGRYHNGRVGKVIGVRHGDVIMRSTDNKSPNIDGARYDTKYLERRVL